MSFRSLMNLVLLLVCLNAPAQQADMNEWLNLGTKTQTKERLVALGVDAEVADSATGLIKWQTARGDAGREYALLFLPCRLDTADLYLVGKNGVEWQVTDHHQFDCHYDDSVSIEVGDLQTPKRDDVLVHHDSEAHGTNYSQQNFKVFNITGAKLNLVLDTEEVIIATPPARDLIQRSQFTAVPTMRSHPYVIEETRSSILNEKLSVQRRVFRWSNVAGKYVPSKFVRVAYP
jgi:hypothetical protein